MNETAPQRKVIPSGAVRRTTQPVVVDCSPSNHSAAGSTISVLPLMDGDVVAGIEVRCGCGSSVLVECHYESKASEQLSTPTEQGE